MENMGNLVDLELDDDSALDMAIPTTAGGRHVPQYPYGLRVSMESATLDKLSLKADIAGGDVTVGDTLHLRTLAKVTSISQDENGCRVEMQITHIFEPVEDEDTE